MTRVSKPELQNNLSGCLVQQAVPAEHVMDMFDALPKPAQDAINYSDYKLCVACVRNTGPRREDLTKQLLDRITFMEQAIRNQEKSK